MPRLITAFGESLPVSTWAKRRKIPAGTIVSRIDKLGWEPEDALTKQPDRRFQTNNRRQTRPVPRLNKHATGQAYCRWSMGGRIIDRYFGVWGSAEANAGYARFATEWASGQPVQLPKRDPGEKCTFAELVARYLMWAATYYIKNGRKTSEYAAIKCAMSDAIAVLGDRRFGPAESFSVDDMRAIIAAMVGRGLARKTVNVNQFRITKMFKWAAVEGFVSFELPGRLAMMPKLRRGQSEAPEWEKKKPVPWCDVEAIFPHLYPDNEERRAIVEALIRCHWFVGCRPSVICQMRPMDIDRSGAVWWLTAPDAINKNAHREQDLVIAIGPRAQAILKPIMATCPDDRPIFALPPRGNGSPWVTIGKDLYAMLIRQAVKRAGVKPWTPHQMRHTRASEIQRIYESSADAATAIGDTRDVTETVYASGDRRAAERIARETG